MADKLTETVERLRELGVRQLVEAAKETSRLQQELDITNADHIALWIEANTIPDEPMNQCASWLACRIVEAHEATIAALTPAGEDALRESVKPWEDYHGDLPDYDHPLRCVFESGVQYAVELLAKRLGVDDYEPCDGTEEFDGDLGGTLMNIVLAAMPTDQHGDPIFPNELPAALSRPNVDEMRDEAAEERGRIIAWLREQDKRDTRSNWFGWLAVRLERCDHLAALNGSGNHG